MGSAIQGQKKHAFCGIQWQFGNINHTRAVHAGDTAAIVEVFTPLSPYRPRLIVERITPWFLLQLGYGGKNYPLF